ncbi:hypothetical protein V5799_024138 [Amblyomma americanum]|uniref:Uncharacterized protein n=1 Tax=Amblyomma americanum TaxID=6943 RepID=A0AAQ4EDA3_AMBAM
MAGLPADYVEWTDSEDDEIVFSDDFSSSGDKLRKAPAVAAQNGQTPFGGGGSSGASRTPAELQEDFRLAVARGNVALARDLLTQGVDVNVESRCHWSALVEASSGGYAEMVRLLLDNGADANFNKGGPAVGDAKCAVFFRHCTMEILVSAGARHADRVHK